MCFFQHYLFSYGRQHHNQTLPCFTLRMVTLSKCYPLFYSTLLVAFTISCHSASNLYLKLLLVQYFLSTNKLGFTPEFLGRVKLVTSVASLIGVGLYNGFLKKVPLRKIFLVTTIFGCALGMSQVCDMIETFHQFMFVVHTSLVTLSCFSGHLLGSPCYRNKS